MSDGISEDPDDYFVANINHAGFYRVLYDPTSYLQLCDAMDLDITVRTVNTSHSYAQRGVRFLRFWRSVEPWATVCGGTVWYNLGQWSNALEQMRVQPKTTSRRHSLVGSVLGFSVTFH